MTQRPRPSTSEENAARKQLAAGLAKLPDTYVDCRDMRHAWRVQNDFHVVKQTQVGRKVTHVGRNLRCRRCPTIRNEVYLIRANGLEKISQSYSYPEDYMLPGVPRGVKPSWIVQQEQFRRAMERVGGALPGQSDRPEK